MGGLYLLIPVTWVLETLLEALKLIHRALGLILKFVLELRDPDDIDDCSRDSKEREQPPDKCHRHR